MKTYKNIAWAEIEMGRPADVTLCGVSAMECKPDPELYDAAVRLYPANGPKRVKDFWQAWRHSEAGATG